MSANQVAVTVVVVGAAAVISFLNMDNAKQTDKT